MDYFQLVCAIGIVLLAIYYYYTSTFDYWKIRGVAGPQPTVFIGNFKDIILTRKSLGDKMREWYEEYKKEPMFGIFDGSTPTLVVTDLELIKDVLIKDFPLFVNRGIRLFSKAEPLGEHLFSLEAERWRPIRTKLSPVFTSGKLRDMFPLLAECSENLEKNLDDLAQTGEPVECRDLAAKFTIDVIGSCAFGINMNALSDENSEFREVGRTLFKQTTRGQIRDICRQFLPMVYEKFGHLLQIPGVDQFLIDVVMDTIKYRRENNIVRPDFINTLMELQDHPEKLGNIELTDSLLTSQAFVFFAAGFGTSSTTISHALYELALNQHIQDKLRKEIREVCHKYQGVLTYDAVKEMKYLDKFFKEVLRKYPLIPFVMREASENYTFRGTKVSIEKGIKVLMPAYGIQRDADIYPEPEKFDPERFNDDAVAARHPMAYLPFGDGPRNCIGARFAQYKSKVGIITIIRNHKVDVCEKTKIPYESDPRSFMLMLKGGVYLKIFKVEN